MGGRVTIATRSSTPTSQRRMARSAQNAETRRGTAAK